MSQNYNKYNSPQQHSQNDSQTRDFNQKRQQLPQPYHFNQLPQQQNYHQSFPQQNYFQQLPKNDLQNQYCGVELPNTFYSPYQNYTSPDDFQQYTMNQYPKANLQKRKIVQTQMKQNLIQLPFRVSQFQLEQVQSTHPLSDNELEYMEFLRFKEFNLKQQQQIDDQDFQDFQEFRKYKQELLLRQRVDQEEEKRQLTNIYRWKHKQVYSEKEYKCQLDKKRNIQQCYSQLILDDSNMEINQEIETLMRPNTGLNQDYQN